MNDSLRSIYGCLFVIHDTIDFLLVVLNEQV